MSLPKKSSSFWNEINIDMLILGVVGLLGIGMFSEMISKLDRFNSRDYHTVTICSLVGLSGIVVLLIIAYINFKRQNKKEVSR